MPDPAEDYGVAMRTSSHRQHTVCRRATGSLGGVGQREALLGYGFNDDWRSFSRFTEQGD